MATIHIMFGLLLFSLHSVPSSTTGKDDTLAPGQTLAVGEKLVSSNGKFALGFIQPGAGGNDDMNNKSSAASPGWYLAIWFNRIPLTTPVWVANRARPIADDADDLRATQLQLTADGNLVVSNHATKAIIWSSSSTPTNATRTTNTTTTTSSVSAVLLGSGCLVIQAGAAAGAVLWQSFDDPTHALLPGAKIGWNKVTGMNRVFTSWKSRTDPGFGSFVCGLLTNDAGGGVRTGTLRRLTYPSAAYYHSWSPADSPAAMQAMQALLQANPVTRGVIVPAYVNTSEEEYYIYTSPDESSSSFSVDTSGQVNLNVWSQANQSWYSIFTQPIDACTVYAACGPFTVCTGSSSDQPCQCMESFSLASPRDWELGDRTGGCSRNTKLDCPRGDTSSTSTDVSHAIARVTLPYGPQSLQSADPAATTRSGCERACLSNCSCTAYSYALSGTGTCST